MNPREVKVRQKVVDRWYSNPDTTAAEGCWGAGRVRKVMKTRIVVKFENLPEPVVYDYPHFRKFVEKGNYFSKRDK